MIVLESAVQLAARIRKKEIGTLKLTKFCIERVEKYDDSINAVAVRRSSKARAAADASLARCLV